MHRLRFGLIISICITIAAFLPRHVVRAADREATVRGILIKPERATAEFLATWKSKGVTGVILPLDEATRPTWQSTATVVERSGLILWPWVEVARNAELADAHPDWMAAPGGHHDDWRRRFPTAPKAKPGEVMKAWPWVPIGYAPALNAHRQRLNALLDNLPGKWSGVFLNDLQAGPSSCGCGNDQCRWALDYGTPETAPKTPGDDAAAKLVAELSTRFSGKLVIPVWVTECELADLADAKDGTGLCGGVPCAKRDCWPRYARNWNPLLKATEGPIALGLWTETFHRDPTRWIDNGLTLFQKPPRGGTSLEPARTVAVVQAWNQGEASVAALLDRMKRSGSGWVLALDPIDQSWEPRIVSLAH
jgi:hypothetical protein